MDDKNRELDLEIVSASWRSVADYSAYEQMLDAWSRKLEAVRREPRIPLLDKVLHHQLDSLEKLLEDRRDIQAEDPLEIAVSQTPAPAMVLSQDGFVVTLNHGASGYFGVRQGSQAGTGWLRDDAIADYNSVHNSETSHANVDYAVVRLSERSGFAEVYQLVVEGIDRAFTVVRSLELDWDPNVSIALMKAFGVTEAESQVCKLLFQHLDLSIVADHRSVSVETIRNQVKSIMSKIEVHSKAELVRLLAVLCARAASNYQKTDLAWSDPLIKETILRRRDGRKLAFTWVGSETGKVVLYVADHTSCAFFSREVCTNLLKGGVKLCILSLPGFGNSDPAACDSEQLEDGCDAIAEWCRQMGSGPVSAMAARGAQFYLFRLATKKPELLRFLLCIGLPWNITQKRAAGMPSVDVTLLKLSVEAPLAHELSCRIGYRMVKKHGPDAYWKRLFSANHADVETTKRQEALPLLRASVRHALAQGYVAFKRAQITHASSPIHEWVRASEVPSHWLIPGLTVNLSEEDFAEIQDMNPLSTLEVADGAGELISFQQPKLFAERVVAIASDEPEQAIASALSANAAH